MVDEEQVDIIDEQGNVLRTVLKTDAHKQGWLHKTVIGYIRYGDDWGLVKQASDRQDAGQLVAPVGGHVSAGETNDEALVRESDEEIGTSNITSKLVGEAIFHRQVIGRDENHLFVVYEISTNDDIKLGAEAVALERLTTAELKNELQNNSSKFGDALYFVFENFYPEYLPENYIARWT